MEEKTFLFQREKETKNTVRFQAVESKCPITTVYVQKWDDYSSANEFQLTLKPLKPLK